MKTIAAFCLLLAAQAQMKERTMHAKGTFDVKVTPQKDDDPSVGRFALDKQFHGDLEATSKGQMLSAGRPASGSAGYVAIEQITGMLGGRKGAFALMHFGTMDHGAQELKVTVVPGSGTGELTGLSGKMKIVIEGGKHFYEFEYALGEAK